MQDVELSLLVYDPPITWLRRTNFVSHHNHFDDFIALNQIRIGTKMASAYLAHITRVRRLNQEGDDRSFDVIWLCMKCLQRTWDQTIAVHSEAKKVNWEAVLLEI